MKHTHTHTYIYHMYYILETIYDRTIYANNFGLFEIYNGRQIGSFKKSRLWLFSIKLASAENLAQICHQDMQTRPQGTEPPEGPMIYILVYFEDNL